MRTISILCVVNVVSALSENSLCNNIHFMDNNRLDGSRNEGTQFLETRVKKGDKVVWTILPLEIESYVSIGDIEIDKQYCDVEKKVYEGTGITYWVGTIKEDLTDKIPYSLGLLLGSRNEPLFTSAKTSLTSVGI